MKVCLPKAGSPNEFDYCVGISKKVLQTKHVSHSCRQLQNFSRLKGKFQEVLRGLCYGVSEAQRTPTSLNFARSCPKKILVSSAPTERSALQCTVEGIVFWIKFYHQVIVTTPTENMFASVCPVSISPVIHVNSASIA